MGIPPQLPSHRPYFAGKISQPSRQAASPQASSIHFAGDKNSAVTWGWRAAQAALLAAGVGTLGYDRVMESNPPGTHSVVYDAWAGGHQDQINGPGRVYLGWKALIPMLGGIHNAPLNTSSQSVVEIFSPSTQEQKVIPHLAVQVDFEVVPEHLHTILADKLGGVKGNPEIPGNTFFVKVDDPNIQKLYLQMIQTPLQGAMNDLTTAYRGENFHTITNFLTVALNDGLKNYSIERSSGEPEIKDIPSLQESVGPYLKINKVHVTEIKLPEDITTKFEEQAKQPLQQEIAVLNKDLQATKEVRNKAEGMKLAASVQEKATQEAEVAKLEETGRIQVETYKAEKLKIDAQADAMNTSIRNEADKEATILEAKGKEEVARILAEAKQYDIETRAKADAGVKEAAGKAEAEAAKLKGEPYKKYPELLVVQAIEGSQQAISALANNPDTKITFIDPGTGLKIDVLNVGNGNGVSTEGLVNHITGQKAANKVLKPQQPTVATPPKAEK